MNIKQSLLMNVTQPDNPGLFGSEGSAENNALHGFDTSNQNLAESNLQNRIYELEEINSTNEAHIVEQENKLAEVVATNAKFLSIIAHDLRSPFSSIIGVLDLLKDSYGEYNIKEVEKYIRMATNSANGTLNLLDNLLSWTTAQNKALFFNPVRIDLHELINEELESLTNYATHKLISLNHTIQPKLFVAADLQMVKTILRNLINNAIKYSFVGGEIMVSAVENDQFVEISVKDGGIGMKQKVINNLFTKSEFHTTRGTNNENGTGLGLILCKEFAEKHGGRIWVESESGKGCDIKFTLPHYI